MFLAIIRKWTRSVDKGHVSGRDLSTVFDSVDHELLIAKLNVEAAAREVL